MKPSFYLLPLLLFQASVIFANLSAPNQISYIQDYKDLAIREMLRTGIPASIILAQALLASDAGRNELAVQANNHFGALCNRNWSGYTYSKSGEGSSFPRCFRAYATVAASFEDHSRLLTDPEKMDRYGVLFRLDVTDYFGWANGLQLAGYSGNSDYAQDLITLIEAYKLFQYDIIFYTRGNLPPKYWPATPEASAGTDVDEERSHHRFGFQSEPDRSERTEGTYRPYERSEAIARQDLPEAYRREESFTPDEGDDLQKPWRAPYFRHPGADHGFDRDQFVAGSRPAEIIAASYRTEVVEYQTTRVSLPQKSLITAQYHKVSRNETLWGIARQYNTSVNRLKQLNNLDTDQIRSGAILRVS